MLFGRLRRYDLAGGGESLEVGLKFQGPRHPHGVLAVSLWCEIEHSGTLATLPGACRHASHHAESFPSPTASPDNPSINSLVHGV